MYEINGGPLSMLLKKRDFCSALMKMSLPVRQYAERIQATGGSTVFLASCPGCTIAGIDEFRTVHIVGGIR